MNNRNTRFIPSNHYTNFSHLKDILSLTLKSLPYKQSKEFTQIREIWDNAVGEVIANNAQPAKLKGNILIVNVSDSTWLHHFQFLKQDMIEKLNPVLEKVKIKDMKFKIGPLF